mmetsp:Transcript_33417/g.60377  ORF Transcript_33417/g.60377 Transcript_33417/m.60377 type:complete len:101 (-) Transcript_33417:294-596(-)
MVKCEEDQNGGGDWVRESGGGERMERWTRDGEEAHAVAKDTGIKEAGGNRKKEKKNKNVLEYVKLDTHIYIYIYKKWVGLQRKKRLFFTYNILHKYPFLL